MERTCTTPGCSNKHVAKGLCGTCYNRANYTYEQRHKPAHVTCSVCSEPMISRSGKRGRKVCSEYCRWLLDRTELSTPVPESHPAHPRWDDRRLPVLWIPPKPRRWAPMVIPGSTWVAGYCARCGNAFTVEHQLTARYCSTTCAKRVGKQAYRARKKQAFVQCVSPRRVYERDGWRCQLCRKKVRRDQVAPHPLAPVLDHIIPLAQGGTHEPANTQCAHFLCNSRKSDSIGTVQLALFG